jgi:hypothetical protein
MSTTPAALQPAFLAILDLVIELLESGEQPRTGKLSVRFGEHNLSVPLDPVPTRVYTAIVEQDPQGCGGSSPSVAAALPTDTGFDVFASIRSATATIYWLAV